jgi:acyl-CoA dehydrogenase
VTDELCTLADVASDVLSHLSAPARVATSEGRLNRALWEELEAIGFTRIGVPEPAGGSGGSFAAVNLLARLCGEYSAQAPVVESMLAGGLLASAGLAVPASVLTVGLGDVRARPTATGWRLRGEISRVAYGRDANWVASVAGIDGDIGRLAFVISPEQAAILRGANLAGEPRDSLKLDLVLPEENAALAPDGGGLVLRGRVTRAGMMCGAMDRALAHAVRYSGERRQFGRPIAAFQAIQHYIAVASAEAAATRAVVDAAAASLEDESPRRTEGVMAANAAKTQADRAAGVVAAAAHQVHGAIGITSEHPLRFSTTRLWSWRDEWGSRQQTARTLADWAAAADIDGLWPRLVGE